MIGRYIKLALKHLTKHRLFAFINIAGLTLGLTIFLFSMIIVDYEKNHDQMFAQRHNIFMVSSLFADTANENIHETSNVRTAYGPLFKRHIDDAKYVSRAFFKKRIISINNKSVFQGIRFVDTDFTRIFNFDYIAGDNTALDDPQGLIITASTAINLFGHINVIGNSVVLGHKYPLRVTAVIQDVANNSHFNSSMLPDFELQALASITALSKIEDFNIEGEWITLDPYDNTYILLSDNRDQSWLNQRVNQIANRYAPENEKEHVKALKVRPLVEANTLIWDAFGFPVMGSIQLLGFLILIIACVNYTNLATTQNLSRAKEVGLRKTLGANRSQLLTQFLIENIAITAISSVLALACIELLLPLYGSWTGKTVTLNYFTLVPELFVITLSVGLLAGAYPAYLISCINPVDSLQSTLLQSKSGHRIRDAMIAVQFAIVIFLLSIVLIINFQNSKVNELSNNVPRSQIVVLEGINAKPIFNKLEVLRKELQSIPAVQSVTYSSTVPFWDVGRYLAISADSNARSNSNANKNSNAFNVSVISVDYDFFKSYDIALTEGRYFDKSITEDFFGAEGYTNVIVNQLTANKLGFGRGIDAIGQSFFSIVNKNNPQVHEFKIVGLKPDNYFYGQTTKMKAIVFLVQPDHYTYASIRISHNSLNNVNETLNAIDTAWNHVISDYPIQRSFLEEYFNLFFGLLTSVNQLLAILTLVALTLALFGLFGLAAFMAQRRTKEIGIRKVMGASVNQIVRLLIWQFSKPVMWSLLLAMPFAYLVADVYLDFFPERITFVIPLIITASLSAIIAAWSIIAVHAFNIAREKPIKSLRYE